MYQPGLKGSQFHPLEASPHPEMETEPSLRLGIPNLIDLKGFLFRKQMRNEAMHLLQFPNLYMSERSC